MVLQVDFGEHLLVLAKLAEFYVDVHFGNDGLHRIRIKSIIAYDM